MVYAMPTRKTREIGACGHVSFALCYLRHAGTRRIKRDKAAESGNLQSTT